MIDIIFANDLPYKYVGDGHMFVAGKVPDFVYTGQDRLLIELAGDFWHTAEEMQLRCELFAKYGYRTLVIWEHEFNGMTADEISRWVRDFTVASKCRGVG